MVFFLYPGGTCFVPNSYCEAMKLFEMETILSIRGRAAPEQLPAVSAKVGTEKCLTPKLLYVYSSYALQLMILKLLTTMAKFILGQVV